MNRSKELWDFRLESRMTLIQIAKATKLSYPTICKTQMEGRQISELTARILDDFMASWRKEHAEG